jgi:hypothetical protein
MSSKASVKKNRLCQRIEEEGYRSLNPCVRCVRLHKVCFKSDNSDRCSECVRAGNSKCAMSKPTYSDSEWRRLVEMQRKIAEERRLALIASQEAMAKVMRLERHEALLRSRAGDFIARDYKEIAELEELERREAEERERLEKERVESERQKCQTESARAATGVSQSAVMGGGPALAATSEDPTLTQMLRDPFFWSNLELPDGIVGQVGGSPSGSR